MPSPNAPLKRVLAYTGCFSRMATIKDIHLYLSQRLRIKEEDMRLWLYNSEVGRKPVTRETITTYKQSLMRMKVVGNVGTRFTITPDLIFSSSYLFQFIFYPFSKMILTVQHYQPGKISFYVG